MCPIVKAIQTLNPVCMQWQYVAQLPCNWRLGEFSCPHHALVAKLICNQTARKIFQASCKDAPAAAEATWVEAVTEVDPLISGVQFEQLAVHVSSCTAETLLLKIGLLEPAAPRTREGVLRNPPMIGRGCETASRRMGFFGRTRFDVFKMGWCGVSTTASNRVEGIESKSVSQ